ncbi:MAG: helix-turn-helix transcriptional regulator [Deltaproteobacteria bacterium]|nr:helix-turn-helix transcriptional regulator [Deltaproteobacteria bacterium]
MTGKQLRAIRDQMKVTQVEFAAKIGMAGGSVARMERGVMIITPSMALLISYVAKEAGVDPQRGIFDHRRSRGGAKGQRKARSKHDGRGSVQKR